MPLISLVINADSRDGYQHDKSSIDGMGKGCRSIDYMIDGVIQKQKYLKEYDFETILFIDQHLEIQNHKLNIIRDLVDTLILREHTHEHSFLDYNFLQAIFMARGQYVLHCDQETNCYTSSPEYIQRQLDLLEQYKFVSYPSWWSPRAITDESFGGRTWASTRYFLCKRETLKFDILIKCIQDPEWAYKTYGDSPRRCNWLEHFLTLTNNDSCFYPPFNLDQYAVFSWGTYKSGTIRMLNEMDYTGVKKWLDAHPIHYPNDSNA